jgi:hypothetical protein
VPLDAGEQCDVLLRIEHPNAVDPLNLAVAPSSKDLVRDYLDDRAR